MNGLRARSTTFRTNNGNTVSVINIGVPGSHPLADNSSMAGPSGLHNVQVGGIQMPAPQFVVVHNNRDGNGQEKTEAGNSGNAGGAQASASTNNNSNPLGDQ